MSVPNNITEDTTDDDDGIATTPNPIVNMEQQMNALVNDIFSTTEFMNFLETLHRNFLEEGYGNEGGDTADDDEEDDDDDEDYISSPNDIDLEVEYNYFIDTITFGRRTVVTSPTPIEFEHYSYEPKEGKCEECSICLVDFETNDDVVSLKCNHLFHKTCIVEWSSHKAECPNCREKI
jgi:hypothetical protein